jgi:hypothetical protein
VRGTSARVYLRDYLSDRNPLKPTVWAKDKYHPLKHFAVSLGIYYHLRPLYLYIKLCNLRHPNDNIALGDVHAQAFDEMKKGTNEEESRGKEACASCKIFFENKESEQLEETNFHFLGNCAEYDIVEGEKTKNKLCEIKLPGPTSNWKILEEECERHIKAFNKLKNKVKKSEVGINMKDMREYYNKIRNANQKALKYKWIERAYKLVPKN